MKQIRACLIGILTLASCSDQYRITGSSSVSMFDGKTIYLKRYSNGESYNVIDSCEIIHGKFNFMGLVDTTIMAELYIEDRSIMPLVVENGSVMISINPMNQSISGSPLNDKLYHFIQQKKQIDKDLTELSALKTRMLMGGYNTTDVYEQYAIQSKILNNKMEKLEAQFIMENYDNILGLSVFMLLCGQYPYPIINTPIRNILQQAPERFANHPYVQNYLQLARTNMSQLEEEQESYPIDRKRKRRRK